MKQENSHSHKWFDSSDLLNQLLMVLVGAVVLLVNFGFLSAAVYHYWPVLLIIVGLRAMMHHR